MNETRDLRERGLNVLRRLGWPENGVMGTDQESWSYTVENLFGQVWARPGLSLRDREIVTLAVLIAIDAQDAIKPHLRYAHNLGLSEDEVREIILQVMYYAGFPKGVSAMNRLRDAKNEPGHPWKSELHHASNS